MQINSNISISFGLFCCCFCFLLRFFNEIFRFDLSIINQFSSHRAFTYCTLWIERVRLSNYWGYEYGYFRDALQKLGKNMEMSMDEAK